MKPNPYLTGLLTTAILLLVAGAIGGILALTTQSVAAAAFAGWSINGALLIGGIWMAAAAITWRSEPVKPPTQ